MSFFNINFFKRSLRLGIKGFKGVYQNEQTFRFQVLTAILVIILIFAFNVSREEAVLLIITISFVLIIELINTSFERVVDMMKPRVHIYAGLIKDIMSGASVLACISAMVIGLIIFIPYFVNLFNNLIF